MQVEKHSVNPWLVAESEARIRAVNPQLRDPVRFRRRFSRTRQSETSRAIPYHQDSGTLWQPRTGQIHRAALPETLGARSGREDNQGDSALGLPRDVSELRISLSCFREEAVALVAGGLLRYHFNRLATDLNRRDRVLL